MRITLLSIFVDDQDAAVDFYSRKLGFEVTADIPVGDARWITLASPEQRDGTQLTLEPSDHQAVAPFKDALVTDGIPMTSFGVDDVRAEHERLTGLGVVFTQPPVDAGGMVTAIFDDTQGNLIQIAQLP
jgi:catechol 2,3-dioxygenase-like lactoylglutathione lyase family enzyme